MILPIYTFGQPALRKEASPVEGPAEAVQDLVGNMIETMRNASGVGLAAPQVGREDRLFVVDLLAVRGAGQEDLPPELDGVDEVAFINPEMLSFAGDDIEFEEGCLSIPDIRDNVIRPESVRIRFLDRNMQTVTIEAAGLLARVVQHEFDHLNGILFIDRVGPLRRRLLRRRLKEMARGEVEADYPLLAAGVPRKVRAYG